MTLNLKGALSLAKVPNTVGSNARVRLAIWQLEKATISPSLETQCGPKGNSRAKLISR